MSGLRVTNLRGETAGTSPKFPDGVVVTGVTTSTSFSGGLTGNVTGNVTGNISGTTGSFTGAVSGATGSFTGNVSVGGTLTYQDVTNVDSVGIITARSGIKIGAGQSVSAVSGIITYYGDGSKLTGIQVGTSDFVGFGTGITAGVPVIVRSDGKVGAIAQTGGSSSVGTAVEFESGASYDQASVFSTPDNKTVLIYRDAGDSGKGKSVVGTVSGSSVSFGSVVEFESGETRGTSIAYDPDTDRVIAHFVDWGNSKFPTWCVGEMQGNSTISWGTPASHYSNTTTGETACVYDTQNNKIVLIWGNTQGGELKTFTGDVQSGSNTLNLGSSQEIGDDANTPDHLTALWHVANNRVVVFFEDIDDSNKGFYSIGQYNSSGSGNAQTWSAPTQWSTGAVDEMASAYDSNDERVIIAYRDTGNNSYGTARVGSLSGTTITWGDAVVFNSGDTEEIAMDWDSDNEQVYIAYKDAGNSDKGTFVTGTISGSNKRTITFSGETVFKNGSINSPSVTYNSNAQKPLVGYSDGAGKGVVVTGGDPTTSNLTTENYIGLAVAGISSGSTGSITIPGGISSGHSGLTTGRTYYVQPGGDLQLSAGSPSVVAGTSISSTQILVR